MKAALQRWRQRIDAMSLRERVFLFLSIAVALVAAVDALVLSPQAAAQKALVMRLRAQATALDTLRQQATADPSLDSPAGRLARELTGLRAELAGLDAEITRRLAGSEGTRLDALLASVLKRHERLVLMKLVAEGAISPPQAPRAARAGAVARGASTPVADEPPAAPTVDLAVRGSYLDLARYVADLERALPGLRWAALSITRRDGGAELQARVGLPGVDR